MDESGKKLGNNLKALREAHGLTQAEMAELLNFESV